jgi:hypothetical protein
LGAPVAEARVSIAAVPQTAPPPLAGVLNATRRADGTVLDWDLSPLLVMEHRATPDDIAAVSATFRRWRSTWRQRFLLGPVAELAQLAAFCAGEGIEMLAALGSLPAIIDIDDIERFDTALAEAEVVLAASTATGWALIRPDATVLGGFSVPGVQRVASGADWELAVVGHRGLRARSAETVHDVTGWRIVNDGVDVSTPHGDERIGGQLGRAIAQLAPGSIEVQVRRAPLAELWEQPLTALSDAAAAAAVNGVHLVVAPATTTLR